MKFNCRIYYCIIIFLTGSALVFAEKPQRFSHNDMRMIMEKNSLQLQGMKLSEGAMSARFGFDSMMSPKIGLGYRSYIDWTYPLALDLGANIFYNPMNKKQILGASLDTSLFVLFNTPDNLPLYAGAGAELKTSAKNPLFHPAVVSVPKFMYSIPMPEPSVIFGKTLKNDSFLEMRYSAPFGSIKEGSFGLTYGFGF